MRVMHVVPGIAEQASGPSYSVPALAAALQPHCESVQVHVLAPAEPRGPRLDLRIHPAWNVARHLGFSPTMSRALRADAPAADVMHNHSLWMMPNVYPARAVKGTACVLVTSPRGTLSPTALRRSAWRKRVMWWLCQGEAVRASHCLHATAEQELRDIRAAGLRGPVAVIPNGVDVPPLADEPSPSSKHGLRTLLFLSRIHPIKGIETLLHAWHEVESSMPDWELAIVGPGDPNYVHALRQLAKQLGLRRVRFAGPMFGREKSETFRQADLFVLPSHSENFGMAVAEALAHGVPAIVTRGAPWSHLKTHDCGWWVEDDATALANCLRESLRASRDELRAKGQRGRAWMQDEFSWPRIAAAMLETYNWLVGGGSPPSFVDVIARVPRQRPQAA